MCTVLVRKSISYLLVSCEQLQISKAEFTVICIVWHVHGYICSVVFWSCFGHFNRCCL